MADSTSLKRTGSLDHRGETINGVSITVAAPATRMSLRARPKAIAPLGVALGLELPQRPKTSASRGTRIAMWLGPDEWLLIDTAEGDMMGARAGVAELHSAVEVSHRNVGLLVEGARAADVINAGCPQDLSLAAFPVGACSRTILGKSEVVLMRLSETSFRVECWRSFSDYVYAYLVDAARGI